MLADIPLFIITAIVSFQFQKYVGMESEGPEYAHTHEYSHHLQFALGVTDPDDGGSNEFARKQELMADAFSAFCKFFFVRFSICF